MKRQRSCLPFHPNFKKNHPSLPSSICINVTNSPSSTLGRSQGATLDPILTFSQHILNNLQNILLRTQTNQFESFLCWCHKNTHVFLCSVKAWLLQISLSRIGKVSSQETSENPKQCSPRSLQVIKTWSCFPTSAFTSLVSSPSANQPQTLFHLFLFRHWHWSSIPGRPSQDLYSFPTPSFLLWRTRLFQILSVNSKSSGQRTFAYQGPPVWNQLSHNIRHAPSLDSFKTLKTELFLQ